MAEEKNFENRIKRYLREQGCYVVKFYGCGGTRAGVPDLIVCANGRFIGVEVKAEDGVVSPLQIKHIEKIKASGGAGIIVTPSEFDEFKNFIKAVINDA